MNNSPLVYVDPSGHNPLLLILFLALLLTSCNSPTEQYTPVGYTPQEEYEAVLGAGEYQIAVELAVSAYDMDTSNVNGTIEYVGDEIDDIPVVYPDIAVTTTDRKIYINGTDTDSPGLFASDMIHEIVHADQIANGQSYLDENGNIINQQGFLLNEYEAYTIQYLWALDHGLSTEDINRILERRDSFYDQMEEGTKKLADEGIYYLPGVPPSKPR